MGHRGIPLTRSEGLISFIVVSHGQFDLVERMLESLEKWSSSWPIEVLVVENLDRNGEFYSAFTFPVRTVYRDRPRGLSENLNKGFASSSGQYLCVVNPDVVFVEEVLDTLLQDIHSGVGDIVAPLAVDPEGHPQDSFRNIPSPIELLQRRFSGQESHGSPLDPLKILHPEWIAATLLFMESRTLEDLGGFDEKFNLYFEDVDLCSRARLAGMRIALDPRVRIVHEPRRASRRELKYLLLHAVSAFRFFTSPVYRDAIRLRNSTARDNPLAID